MKKEQIQQLLAGLTLLIIIFVTTGCTNTPTTSENQPQNSTKPEVQKETQATEIKQPESTETQTTKIEQPEPAKEISYKIVEEEDISYAGCKRVGIRIVVPDDSEKTDVESVMQKIINGNKSKWDDITVWAYKNSEENQVGILGYTMGMKEYSVCP